MELIQGDCLEVLKTLNDESIDLVITSPPYAEQRKTQYTSISSDTYVEWFINIAKEIHRVLKKSGTFILNIKEHTTNGKKDTYVLNLVLELSKSFYNFLQLKTHYSWVMGWKLPYSNKISTW